MTMYEHLIDAIGDTPLVRLHRVVSAAGARVYAKVEYLNPGGSVKDRAARAMVEAAEADGTLRPGGTLVEPTSGNTGVGLALLAQRKGYRCVFTCPDKVSKDKIDMLRAYGAEVVVCPAAVPLHDPRSYRSTAARLAAEIPGAVHLNQYANRNNAEAHYRGTGPELWQQTDGRITHLVAGVGTGGTISGTGRYLKEVSGGAVRIVGADPDGSIYSGATIRPYLLEGVGQPSLPASYDPAAVDAVVQVSDADALRMTRRLAREEGLLVGGSGGMAVVAAADLAATLGPGDLVVVLLPDSGRGYLSKIFNDDWMAGLGLLDPPTQAPRIRDVPVAEPILVAPEETLRNALKVSRECPGRPLLVTAAPAPVRPAEALGTIAAPTIMRALAAGAHPDAPVAGHLDQAPLPRLGAGQPLDTAVRALAAAPAALVLSDGRITGLLTAEAVATALARPFTAPPTASPSSGEES